MIKLVLVLFFSHRSLAHARYDGIDMSRVSVLRSEHPPRLWRNRVIVAVGIALSAGTASTSDFKLARIERKFKGVQRSAPSGGKGFCESRTRFQSPRARDSRSTVWRVNSHERRFGETVLRLDAVAAAAGATGAPAAHFLFHENETDIRRVLGTADCQARSSDEMGVRGPPV